MQIIQISRSPQLVPQTLNLLLDKESNALIDTYAKLEKQQSQPNNNNPFVQKGVVLDSNSRSQLQKLATTGSRNTEKSDSGDLKAVRVPLVVNSDDGSGTKEQEYFSSLTKDASIQKLHGARPSPKAGNQRSNPNIRIEGDQSNVVFAAGNGGGMGSPLLLKRNIPVSKADIACSVHNEESESDVFIKMTGSPKNFGMVQSPED